MLVDIRELGWCPAKVLLRSTVLVEMRSLVFAECLSLVGALEIFYWHPRAFPNYCGCISCERCFMWPCHRNNNSVNSYLLI